MLSLIEIQITVVENNKYDWLEYNWITFFKTFSLNETGFLQNYGTIFTGGLSGANFINILHFHFSFESELSSFLLLRFCFYFFAPKYWCKMHA